MFAVQLVEQDPRGGLAARGDKSGARIGEQVVDGIVAPGIDDGAAVLRWEERRVPVLRAVGGKAAVVGQHDEGRQIVVEAAQTVADPATHAGEARQLETGRLKISCLTMHSGFANQVVDKRQVVDHRTEIGDDFTQQLAALAIRLEFPDRLHPRPKTVLEGLDVFAKIALLSVALQEFRLEIEQVHLRRTALHPEQDYALGLGREMRLLWRQRILRSHCRHCHTAETAADGPEEASAAGGNRIDWMDHDGYLLYRNSLEAKMA